MDEKDLEIKSLKEQVDFLQEELRSQDAKIDFLEKELYGDPSKFIKRRKKKR